MPPDPAGPQPANEPTPDGAWLEERIPAVFVAVLGTWVLIAGWKALRHLVG